MLKTILTGALLVGGFYAYVTHEGHVDGPKITEKEKIVYNQVKPKKVDEEVENIEKMSPTELADWIAKHPVPIAKEPDGNKDVIHYDKATTDAIMAMANHDDDSSSSTTSAQDTLNSGDATYTGSSDDSDTGSVNSSTTSSPSTVPAGYHWVKTYTTKKGTVVKGHLSKNRSTKKKTTTNTDLSTKTFSHSHDVAQRQKISHQNFPGQRISSSDPTVIIGTTVAEDGSTVPTSYYK
jgi:hypothetical protein